MVYVVFMQAAVVTTIGYVIGAPNVDVEGFNIYHKNRLISVSKIISQFFYIFRTG